MSVQMIGNAKLLEMSNKMAFLSSRKIAPDDVLRCYGGLNTEICSAFTIGRQRVYNTVNKSIHWQ